MAKAKKRSSKPKSTKKSPPARAKKAAPRKKPSSRTLGAAPRLDADARSKLLSPPSDFDDTIERFAAAWSNHARSIRVPGVTPSKLTSSLAKAQKAAARYEQERVVIERKLAAFRDAKALATDQAWRGLLDAWAIVKAHLRVSPELAEVFAFMSDAFPGGGPRRTPAPEPTSET